jgi:hypothetical protein
MAALDDLLGRKQQRIEHLHRLEAGRTGLLVIDMQRAFLEPGADCTVPNASNICCKSLLLTP